MTAPARVYALAGHELGHVAVMAAAFQASTFSFSEGGDAWTVTPLDRTAENLSDILAVRFGGIASELLDVLDTPDAVARAVKAWGFDSVVRTPCSRFDLQGVVDPAEGEDEMGGALVFLRDQPVWPEMLEQALATAVAHVWAARQRASWERSRREVAEAMTSSPSFTLTLKP